MARTLDCSPALIRFCKKGKRALTAEAAAKVRSLADLGPAGTIVREVIKAALPNAKSIVTHSAAKLVVAKLSKAGLLTPSGQRAAASQARIVGPITCSRLDSSDDQTARR
jgi:hypothetical protein